MDNGLEAVPCVVTFGGSGSEQAGLVLAPAFMRSSLRFSSAACLASSLRLNSSCRGVRRGLCHCQWKVLCGCGPHLACRAIRWGLIFVAPRLAFLLLSLDAPCWPLLPHLLKRQPVLPTERIHIQGALIGQEACPSLLLFFSCKAERAPSRFANLAAPEMSQCRSLWREVRALGAPRAGQRPLAPPRPEQHPRLH